MIRFAEYVSLGHPDKIADYISQSLLDRYIDYDPKTRYAVEVQIKDHYVMLGGEVSSELQLSHKEIEKIVREAVNNIGYDKRYQLKWGVNNTIAGDYLTIRSCISHQSGDIAKGLNGWGDQGIFFGFSTPDRSFHGMPKEHSIAKRLCKDLFDSKWGGLDIKTQVITTENDIEKVIVAIPLLKEEDNVPIREWLYEHLHSSTQIVINGTGQYIKHSSVADCGTTGRKLVVDFYGGACRIGGGSPWTKDGSKADLTLNLYARKLAKQYAYKLDTDIYVSLACCIGQQEVYYSICDGSDRIIEEGRKNLSPSTLIKEMNLDKPIYGSMCKWGLFGEYQQDKAWEDIE